MATDTQPYDCEKLLEKITELQKPSPPKNEDAAKPDVLESVERNTKIAATTLALFAKVCGVVKLVIDSGTATNVSKVLASTPLFGAPFEALLLVLEAIKNKKKVTTDLELLLEEVNKLFKYMTEVITCIHKEGEDAPLEDQTIEYILSVLSKCVTEAGKMTEIRNKKKLFQPLKNLCGASAQSKILEALKAEVDKVIRDRTLIVSMKTHQIVLQSDITNQDLHAKTQELLTSHHAVVSVSTEQAILTQDDRFQQIKDCKRIDDFVKVYVSQQFQASLDRISVAQREGGVNAEEWAEEWARKLLVNDEKAKDLNMKDRKICLELLYTMCDCWQPDDKSKATVSGDDIVKTFKDKRVVRILTLCVIMDRAQALYFMKLDGHPAGMHWYAKKHVDESEEWRATTLNYDGFPTINRRLFWLVELFNLGGKLNERLKPTKADWSGDKDPDIGEDPDDAPEVREQTVPQLLSDVEKGVDSLGIGLSAEALVDTLAAGMSRRP